MTLLQLTEECAKRGTQVSEAQMSRIDRGKAVPQPALRAVLADVLGLDAYHDFEVKPDEPADPPPARGALPDVRDAERSVPPSLPELQGTHVADVPEQRGA